MFPRSPNICGTRCLARMMSESGAARRGGQPVRSNKCKPVRRSLFHSPLLSWRRWRSSSCAPAHYEHSLAQNDGSALLAQGKAAMRRGDTATAESLVKGAVGKDPDSAEGYFLLRRDLSKRIRVKPPRQNLNY